MTETQWPPAPKNARRIVVIYHLQLEFDGEMLYGTQPYYEKRQRRERLFAIGACAGLAGAIMAAAIMLGALSTLHDWVVMASLLAPILFGLPLMSVGASWMTSRILRTGRFSISRPLQIFRTSGGRFYPLHESAAIVVTRLWFFVRPIYIVWLATGSDSNKRLGLASFTTPDIVEQAKETIEEFLWPGRRTEGALEIPTD